MVQRNSAVPVMLRSSYWFWFKLAETKCCRKSWIHSKSDAEREKALLPTYYIWREHNYIPDVQSWWFIDESLAQRVLERWSVAEAGTGNLFYSQVCHLLPPTPTTCADKIYSNNSGIMLLCCKSNNKKEKRFGHTYKSSSTVERFCSLCSYSGGCF